jgi:hypothetical protein
MNKKNMLAVAFTLVFGFCALHASAEKDPMVGGAAMYPTKNIVENAVNSKDHTTLVAAVKAAGLVETLQGPGPFTVFAPTNEAFDKLPAGTVDTLLKPENLAQLKKILTYHVVAGKLTSKDIAKKIKAGGGKAMLTTVEGGTLTAMMIGACFFVYCRLIHCGTASRPNSGFPTPGRGCLPSLPTRPIFRHSCPVGNRQGWRGSLWSHRRWLLALQLLPARDPSSPSASGQFPGSLCGWHGMRILPNSTGMNSSATSKGAVRFGIFAIATVSGKKETAPSSATPWSTNSRWACWETWPMDWRSRGKYGRSFSTGKRCCPGCCLLRENERKSHSRSRRYAPLRVFPVEKHSDR